MAAEGNECVLQSSEIWTPNPRKGWTSSPPLGSYSVGRQVHATTNRNHQLMTRSLNNFSPQPAAKGNTTDVVLS